MVNQPGHVPQPPCPVACARPGTRTQPSSLPGRARCGLVLATVAWAACAHPRAVAPAAPVSAAVQRLVKEAAQLTAPQFEEDFLNARLIYQALPPGAAQRPALRALLLRYLLDPVRSLDPARITAAGLTGNDLPDQILSSFHDALDLFEPEALWVTAGVPAKERAFPFVAMSNEERALLIEVARLCVTVFGRRGDETASALALSVLATLDPDKKRWQDEIEVLLDWAERGRALSSGESGPEGLPSARRLLEATLEHWPAPEVVHRLSGAHGDRRNRLGRLLRRPLGGGGAPGSGSDALDGGVLRDNDGIPATAASLAAVYLRARRPDLAQAALERDKDAPADDPGLRALLAPFAQAGAAPPEAYLALARRFLPKVAPLGGTSSDRIDDRAAYRVLELGVLFHPTHLELLVLHSRMARMVGAPLLGLRLLEEAEAALERGGGTLKDHEGLSRELVELAFSLLRVHVDPENVEPMLGHAESLRARLQQARKQFGDDADWLSETAVDLELARNFVDAGLVERARPIYDRLTGSAEAGAEVSLQLANILTKSGEHSTALRLLRTTLDRHRPETPPHETIGFVELQCKLQGALGHALDLGGRPDEAEAAYRAALRGWERLMTEHFRRRNRNATAEALVEIGKLLYVLGQRDEGVEKFQEAIAIADGRDQTYIDALAFLVQRGDVEPAVDIYRVAISRPGQTVSEYVKVYASLWIQDLTRRSGRPPEATAQAYLEGLAARALHLRPMRAAAWYVALARYATGKVTYEALLPQANTAGRKAELYFYEAMRRLADGKSDEANKLWSQVLETKMLSFFEFEMAARYLRLGAPIGPASPGGRPGKPAALETI